MLCVFKLSVAFLWRCYGEVREKWVYLWLLYHSLQTTIITKRCCTWDGKSAWIITFYDFAKTFEFHFIRRQTIKWIHLKRSEKFEMKSRCDFNNNNDNDRGGGVWKEKWKLNLKRQSGISGWRRRRLNNSKNKWPHARLVISSRVLACVHTYCSVYFLILSRWTKLGFGVLERK